jgi:hypothetical protein
MPALPIIPKTVWAQAQYPLQTIERSATDWLQYAIKDGRCQGRGGRFTLTILGFAIATTTLPSWPGVVVADQTLAIKSQAMNALTSKARKGSWLCCETRAVGPHTTFKLGINGKVSNYATYVPNFKNPTGFQEVKRVDLIGKAHRNPDGVIVPAPHVREAGAKGVRPARVEEQPI